MAVDTVTLELAGDVSLDEFAEATVRFRALLVELGKEVAGGVRITWLIDSLEVSSAVTGCRGVGLNGTPVAEIERVVRAFGEIGQTLERGAPIPYSPVVARETYALLSILNDRVPSIRFETPEIDATVSLRPEPRRQTDIPTRPSYGAVEGRVQTLSSRGGLRFTLYDTLYDRAVSCYLSENFDQERLRGVWGHRASVEGLVKREPATGRPLAIRQVTDVVILAENSPGDYRQARGAVSVPAGSPLPEHDPAVMEADDLVGQGHTLGPVEGRDTCQHLGWRVEGVSSLPAVDLGGHCIASAEPSDCSPQARRSTSDSS